MGISSPFWSPLWTLLLAQIFFQISPSVALIRHCYPKTDDLRETELRKYPHMKNYLESSTHTGGRLGLLHLVNWQDPVLDLSLDSALLPSDLKDVKCRWRMWIPKSSKNKLQMEAENFNNKTYTGNDLHADPCNNRNFHRIIACETEKCIQFWNVFVRPLSKPDFPVQVYYNYDKEVSCSLEFMKDDKHKFYLKDQNPPYIFEWTGPKKCKFEAKLHATFDEKHCTRFSPDRDCHDRIQNQNGHHGKCTLSLGQNSVAGGGDGYDNTDIHITSESVHLRNSSRIQTQSKSVLRIKKASPDHDGRWRCIVYDYFGISSHPDAKGSEFLKKHDLTHRGIVFIHCKDVGVSVGVPIAIILFITILLTICIKFCKQCTDYNSKVTPDETFQEGARVDKKSEGKITKVPTPKLSNHDLVAMDPNEKPQSLSGIDLDISGQDLNDPKASGGEGGKRKNKKKRKHKPAAAGTMASPAAGTQPLVGLNKKEV